MLHRPRHQLQPQGLELTKQMSSNISLDDIHITSMFITNKNHGIHTVYYYEHVFSWQPRFQYNRESREFDSYPYQAIFRLPQAKTSQHNNAKKYNTIKSRRHTMYSLDDFKYGKTYQNLTCSSVL